MDEIHHSAKVLDLLTRARALGREYYLLTGRPLGVTGEVAEGLAAELLGLTLAPPRQEGYDAFRTVDGDKEMVQIKSRVLQGERITKDGIRMPKQGENTNVGAISLVHEWDVVVLVLMNERIEPTAVFEMTRAQIEALGREGAASVTVRVSTFRKQGRHCWGLDKQL